MSTLMIGRLRQFGLATLLTGLMMTSVSVQRADGSIIRAPIDQKVVYYSTSGTLGSPVDYLEFVGVSTSSPTKGPAGVFYMPGVFSLGGFTALAVPEGQSQTFDALPFSITLNVFGDPFAGAIVSQILIEGLLDGELTSSPGKGLLATISSVQQLGEPIGMPPFQVADLTILAPQFIMPAGQFPALTTPLYAYVNAQVPEPTALATLGVGLAALVVHRRRRNLRARAEGSLA